MTLQLTAIAPRSESRRDLDHARGADDRALGTGAPRGVRAMLGAMVGGAVVAAFVLALTFVQ